jgi:hypothetical protein
MYSKYYYTVEYLVHLKEKAVAFETSFVYSVVHGFLRQCLKSINY